MNQNLQVLHNKHQFQFLVPHQFNKNQYLLNLISLGARSEKYIFITYFNYKYHIDQLIYAEIDLENRDRSIKIQIHDLHLKCQDQSPCQIKLSYLHDGYFKIQAHKETKTKQFICLQATVFYDKKVQECQSKIFQLVLCRHSKDNEIEVSKFEIDLAQVTVEQVYSKKLQDRCSKVQIKATSECKGKGQSPVRKSYPQQGYRDSSRKTLQQPFSASKKQIQIIRFSDDEIQKQAPIINPMMVINKQLLSKSKQKVNVSFRNISMKQDQRSDSRSRQRNIIRRKSRETSNTNTSNTPKHSSNVQQKLFLIQEQLGQSRMRKSTIYENMNQQKQQIIQNLKQANGKLQIQLSRTIGELEFSNKQLKTIQSRYEQYRKKAQEFKQKVQKLGNQNAELTSLVNYLKSNNATINRSSKQLKSQQQNKRIFQTDKITRELQKCKKQNKKLQASIESVETQKINIENNYQQILKKYKMVSTQMSREKSLREDLIRKMDNDERQFHKQLKQKQQNILQLKRQTKELQLKMIRPNDQLTKQQHVLLKQRLQKLLLKIEQDGKENKQLEMFLRKQIDNQKRQNRSLMQKLSTIEHSYNDEMNIYVNKQKSLNKALTQKDKRISQQNKQLEKLKTKLSENNKFIQSQKQDLIHKMSFLTDQLTKRKQVNQELQIVQGKNKELLNKIKQISSQKQLNTVELQRTKQELVLVQNKVRDHNSSLALVQQLQGQLVKLNMKMANTMQLIFDNDPNLAQSIIQKLNQP